MNLRSIIGIGLAAGALVAAEPTAALAQTGLPSGGSPSPGLPAPHPISPDQLGGSFTNRYLVTSAANDRGAFFWVIDTIDRKVTLCERTGTGTDFTCTKKALP
jgi:hypothetical protein